MTKMPLAPPTRTQDDLGQVKEDLAPVPNYRNYIPAAEWNAVCDELIATANLALSLAATGAVGTLQNVYNNGVSSPQTITVDSARGGIFIKDKAGGLGSNLLQVSTSASAPLFYSSVADWLLVNASGTGIKCDQANAAVRLQGSGGRDFLPAADGLGTLGSAGLPLYWGGLETLAIGSKYVTVSSSATPVFDASQGMVQRMVLTSNLTSLTINNLEQGGYFIVILEQSSGGHGMTVPMSGNVKYRVTENSSVDMVGLSVASAAKDVFLFTTDNVAVFEIGRWQEDAPSARATDVDISSGGIITLNPTRIGAVRYHGTLTNPAVINFTTPGAHAGMRYILEFDTVTTDTFNTLQFQSGGVFKKAFSLAATMSGAVIATYTGSEWRFTLAGTYQ